MGHAVCESLLFLAQLCLQKVVLVRPLANFVWHYDRAWYPLQCGHVSCLMAICWAAPGWCPEVAVRMLCSTVFSRGAVGRLLDFFVLVDGLCCALRCVPGEPFGPEVLDATCPES